MTSGVELAAAEAHHLRVDAIIFNFAQLSPECEIRIGS